MECLIDSGAADSIVSQGLISKSNYLSNIKPTYLPFHKTFITGNSAEMCSNQTITFSFEVQGVKLETTAYILPTCGSFSMIYGLSSMKDAKAKLDLDRGTIKLSKKNIPLKSIGYLRIPPGKSKLALLQGKIPKNLDTLPVSMTFTNRFSSNAPKQSLVTIDKNRVAVCLHNKSSKPLVLTPKFIVGRLNVNSLLDVGESLGEENLRLPLVTLASVFSDCWEPSTTEIPLGAVNTMSAPTDESTETGGAWQTDISSLNYQLRDKASRDKAVKHRHISTSRKLLREARLQDMPMVDEDNLDLYLSDEEILRRDVDLTNSSLNSDSKEKLLKVMIDNREAFSLFGEVGNCVNSSVSITLKNEEGFFIRPFRYSDSDKQIIRKEIDKMVKQGILIKSSATHVSPVLLVKKKQQDGTMKYRIVVDFRSLNQRLVKPIYAQYLVQDAINKIGESGAKYVSLIDLKEAYHALNLDPNSRKYTGVIPFYGHASLTYSRLPMGLAISGAEFTNKILEILEKLPQHEDFCVNILDDLLVLSRSEEEHLEHLTAIIELFSREGLKISPKKTKIAHKSFSYMGYEISFDINGEPIMKIEKSKIDAICRLPPPKTPKQVKSFIGMIQYLARFLPKLNISLIPLYELTKKSVPFKWTHKHQEVFDQLKDLVTSAPAVSLPTRDGVFLLEIDTSRIGTGSILKQIQNGQDKIIAFNSKKLPTACASYSVSELELSGILINLKSYKSLLGNRHFYVSTDHKSLLGLLKSKVEPPTPRLARLVEKLLAFNFSLSYKKGANLIVADYLSRNPLPDDDPDSKPQPIAFLHMSPYQAQATRNSILNNADGICNVLTRSMAKAQNITLPEVHKISTENTIKSPKTVAKDKDMVVPAESPPESTGDYMSQPDLLGDDRPPAERRYSPRLREQLDLKREAGKAMDLSVPNIKHIPQRNSLFVDPFLLSIKKSAEDRDYEEENGISQEEDTIKAITDTEEAIVDTETQLDIEKHLWPTSGVFVTESVDPPKDGELSSEAKQIFEKRNKSKIYSYRFSKQKDLDPLIRIIDQRHMSQYRVGFTKQRLSEETKKDDRLGPIFEYLLSGKVPHKRADLERMLASVDNYFIYDDALFYYELISDGEDMHYRLCIPKSLVRYILDSYHRQNVGSHLGITRTYATLNSKYKIHGLYRQIVNYIKACDLCQQRSLKVREKTIVFPRELNEDLRPFQRFSCDLRNMNVSSGGHKYLFVAVCEVTHYIIAIPMKKPTARAIANLILNKFIFVYGRPEIILFDLAKYFCSKIMAYLSQAVIFKIKFIYKTQHHASRVERYMRSIKNSLIAHLSGKANMWPCFVDACVYALNTFRSPALANYSAYELVFKHEPSSLDGFELQPVTGICKDLDEYITIVKNKFNSAKAMVQEYNTKIQNKQFLESARDYRHKPIEVGQLCSILNPENTKVYNSDNRAIRLNYVGPYICAGRDKSGVFLEKLDGTYLSHPVYAGRVKPVAIQTIDGKMIRTKSELLEYLESRHDEGAELLRKGLIGGQTKIVDSDGIPSEGQDTLMTMDGSEAETHSQSHNSSQLTNNGLDIVSDGITYTMTKARFKHGILQVCLVNFNSNIRGRDFFWVIAEEHQLWEPCLEAIEQGKIKVTGRPIGKKFRDLNICLVGED